LQNVALKHSRYGHRDAPAILIAYRHELRASELCELTWNMIELDSGRIHVRRTKNGVDGTHPLTGKEIRALRQLRRGESAKPTAGLSSCNSRMARPRRRRSTSSRGERCRIYTSAPPWPQIAHSENRSRARPITLKGALAVTRPNFPDRSPGPACNNSGAGI